MPTAPLQAQRALEAALHAAPENATIRAAYFAHLADLAGSHVGLATARLPELPHPLWFRCGTSDLASLRHVFEQRSFGLELTRAPARILDLRAYAGYTAVFLALRFPAADILCAEPAAASFRLLILNTLPYRNIMQLNVAPWARAARLRVTEFRGGDRGAVLAEAEGDRGTVPGQTVQDIMASRNWDRADLIRCDAATAEMVFRDDAPWLEGMQALLMDAPDRTAAGPALDLLRYSRVSQGDVTLFERRGLAPAARPRRISLLQERGLIPMRQGNVHDAPWSFYLFEDRGCQLHPNGPGLPPAELTFTLDCAGQTQFGAVLNLAQPEGGTPAEPVLFRLLIRRLQDEVQVMDAQCRIEAGTVSEWRVAVPVLEGRHEITLRTEIDDGAASNMNAWARWIDPALT